MASNQRVVAIGLGANLGSPAEMIRSAADEILASTWLQNGQCSRLYETKPVGMIDQPEFINAVVVGQTACSPDDILCELQSLEKRRGRAPSQRWGPRVLDLDLLLVGDERRGGTELQLPHPELHQRAFVLIPLAELVPKLIHPVLGRTISELLQRLDNTEGVRPWTP
jgi:2-amino-4-hydroxy-6-hydroxymethyldihydropteridine diphosphokinase